MNLTKATIILTILSQFNSALAGGKGSKSNSKSKQHDEEVQEDNRSPPAPPRCDIYVSVDLDASVYGTTWSLKDTDGNIVLVGDNTKPRDDLRAPAAGFVLEGVTPGIGTSLCQGECFELTVNNQQEGKCPYNLYIDGDLTLEGGAKKCDVSELVCIGGADPSIWTPPKDDCFETISVSSWWGTAEKKIPCLDIGNRGEPDTDAPTDSPTDSPTHEPTASPTNEPTASPTEEPTGLPPTSFPTISVRPQFDCAPCTNEPSPGLIRNDRTCDDWEVSKQCQKKPNKWLSNGYCEKTCYDLGYPYDEDVKCCKDVINRVDTESPTAAPTTPVECYVEVQLLTDKHPTETSFAVQDDSGKIMFAGNGFTEQYRNYNSGQKVGAGAYTFTIYDKYQDGMIGGEFAVKVNGVEVGSGQGDFGKRASIEFSCEPNDSGSFTGLSNKIGKGCTYKGQLTEDGAWLTGDSHTCLCSSGIWTDCHRNNLRR